MWATIKRAIVPLLLLICGVASLIYGAKFHATPVVQQKEVEVPIAPSELFPPPLFGEPPLPGEPAPFGEPPPFLTQAKETILIAEDELEPAIIRDVTVGGLVLLASGELKRTYSGEAPSLCPT